MTADNVQERAQDPPTSPSSWEGCSESSEEDDDDDEVRVHWVDTAERCNRVCSKLKEREIIAVDIEGVNLGRDGEVCIVQIADHDKRVFLFDVTTMGDSIFESGLKEMLEDERVTKLMFDCRSDADALFHIHGVKIPNVLDMQVLCSKANRSGNKHLTGMSKALAYVLPYAEAQRLKGIKLAGQRMFTQDRSGRGDIWKCRPLPPVLEVYCASDVVNLFTMFRHWRSEMDLSVLRGISEARASQRINYANLASCPDLALVDFVAR
eukprot:TRINITY_DN31996_c0_g1_i1.p1 TRINITY_DN31996_c0_g1~~TRINITY_DN31996_c0_g1_i1.p1  ORF type:complete len:265 (+),score=35.92 TRINITY_DN31996_c0_g1_i1:41-835(+)